MKRPLKIAAYIHDRIRREGMRDQLILNAVDFTANADVLNHLRTLLPSWRELPSTLKALFPPNLRVTIVSGNVSNFLLKYDNDENDSVTIMRTALCFGRIELTEPLTPDPGTEWKVAARGTASWKDHCQPEKPGCKSG